MQDEQEVLYFMFDLSEQNLWEAGIGLTIFIVMVMNSRNMVEKPI